MKSRQIKPNGLKIFIFVKLKCLEDGYAQTSHKAKLTIHNNFIKISSGSTWELHRLLNNIQKVLTNIHLNWVQLN